MEIWIAGFVFFGFPLLFVIFTCWLVFTERTQGEDVCPLRDATGPAQGLEEGNPRASQDETGHERYATCAKD